jgi:hypothetical protein
MRPSMCTAPLCVSVAGGRAGILEVPVRAEGGGIGKFQSRCILYTRFGLSLLERDLK